MPIDLLAGVVEFLGQRGGAAAQGIQRRALAVVHPAAQVGSALFQFFKPGRHQVL